MITCSHCGWKTNVVKVLKHQGTIEEAQESFKMEGGDLDFIAKVQNMDGSFAYWRCPVWSASPPGETRAAESGA